MLLQKRIGYGFNGYQVPETPRRTRSSRRWSAFKISNDDNRISSFDLLASVAGKVLLEGRNDPISSDKTSDIENQCVDIENKCVDKYRTVKKSQDSLVKADNLDHGKKKIVVSELVQEAHRKRNCCKESSSLSDNTHFGYTSGITSFDSSDRADPWDRVKWGHKYETGSCSYDSNKSNYDEILPMNNNNPSENAGKVSGHLFMKNEYPLFGSRNRMLIWQKGVPQDCYRVIRDGGVNLDSRDGNGDDDENTACFLFGNLGKPFRSTPCIGGRRIRKILASKCTYQNNATAGNCDMNLKNGYYDKRLRQEKNYPIKKRRYLKCLSLSDNDDSTSCEDISGSTQKVIAAGDWNMNRGDSSSVAGESHVKLRIKSFKVPELSVEMPETATVGSLKRTVMEAVTAILGGGLDIGVLVQGKQIRDDSKTLIQTGISEDSHSDKLKFCLEPSSSSGSLEFLSPDNSDSSHPWYLSKSLTRHLATKGNSVESVHSAADTSATERTKALVPVPPVEAKAISVVPPGKLKRYEAAQRRTRRPFSVYEVEALVQAVEKLGTGRWRDVKMRAFEKSKHRTYVDLKDKWKTLVHTARISPQQRRGEPVPQAVLDRVLAAHAYWTPKRGRFN